MIQLRSALGSALVAGLSWASAAGALAASLPTGFQETVVFQGLTNPTAVRFAPDGRVFVAEQRGTILVFDGLGDPTPDLAFDLQANVMSGWDGGLLGLAIHPDFPASPYVYALYTRDAPIGGTAPTYSDACNDSAGCPVSGRLSRFEISSSNAQVGLETPLITDQWCAQHPIHSVGDLVFGPEGALYVSAGDGARAGVADHGQGRNPCGDPMGGSGQADDQGGALHSQDLLTPGDPLTYSGSILRLDVGSVPATAWPSNPYVGGATSADDPIIAHGLRNPFRMAFRPGTNQVYVGDVGWSSQEEIDILSDPDDLIVENFGWPCYEGGSGALIKQGSFDGADLNLCEGLYAGTIASHKQAALYAYSHTETVVPGETECAPGDSSVTGLAFYAGGSYPVAYENALFFQDSSRQCIWVMFPDASGVPSPSTRTTFLAAAAGRPVDLQIGPEGDLYYADYEAGSVVRIEYYPGNPPPVAVLSASPTAGLAPLTVDFDASGSHDEDPAGVLGYEWDLDGDGQFDDAPLADARFARATYATSGTRTVSVRVSDGLGKVAVAQVLITIDNSPPVAAIVQPTPSLTWRVGDSVDFSGEASDLQDGVLGPAALSWRLLLHHCFTLDNCHQHVLRQWSSVSQGSFVTPDHEYPAWLELELTARDWGGDWFDDQWLERRKLSFENAGQLEALLEFPVLVALDASRIDYSLTQDQGQDLRFVDGDGSVLPHQIEGWNEGGISQVWVRVPRVEGSSNDDFIWMYYGSPSAADGQAPQGVWEPDFAGVWHLHQDLLDSTANDNHGVNQGSLDVGGKVGSAQAFGGDDWIAVPSSPSLSVTGQLTVEAWIKINNSGQSGSPSVVSKKPAWNSSQGYQMEYKPGQNRATLIGSGSNSAVATPVDLDTSWHYLAASLDGSYGRIFVDGLERTLDGSATPLVAGSQALAIGRRGGGGNYFSGAIDEVRISNRARSPAWLHAQYLSMTDGFVRFGPADTGSPLTHTTGAVLHPQTLTLGFDTSPSGLEIAVGSELVRMPFFDEFIIGSATTISAPSPQPGAGSQLVFQAWSDGGDASHDITVTPGETSFLATFVATLCGNGALDAGEECDDGNLQGGDCCSASCALESDGSACSDENACTQTDTCQAGTCTGSNPVVCSAVDQCHVAGTCAPATGTCSSPLKPNGSACNDGTLCSQSDTCQGGVCAGSNPIVCTAQDQCHVVGVCNPANGICSNPIKPAGSVCSDGNACTQSDSCQAGACIGSSAVVCSALDQCHVAGTCDPASGICSNPPAPAGSACSDGDPCTLPDTCQAGVCTGAPIATCSGWLRRRKISFANSGQAEPLQGFPVLVALDASRIDYALTQQAGQDLRFVDPDGTLLPHQIEQWSEAGASYVWVRVPQIDASSTGDFVWMYYGNSSAADGQNPAAVWDASYAGVWHLHRDLLDSTLGGNDGTDNGSLEVAGRVGSARGFDGNDWIDLGSAANLSITGQLTLEAWIKIEDPEQAGSPCVLSKKPAWKPFRATRWSTSRG